MLIVLPLTQYFFKIHESMYCIIVISLEALAFIILPFMDNIYYYYVVQILTIAQYGAWANARTLISFCINSDEIGKIYAAVGIMAALMPILSNPIYRQFYNAVSN